MPQCGQTLIYTNTTFSELTMSLGLKQEAMYKRSDSFIFLDQRQCVHYVIPLVEEKLPTLTKLKMSKQNFVAVMLNSAN